MKIIGSEADDLLVGSSRDDTLDGKNGDDLLFGKRGADWLYGGDFGTDILIGGRGKDNIASGLGDDMLVGGRGTDTFHFLITPAPNTESITYSPWGIDRVMDFKLGKDKILIRIEAFDPDDASAFYNADSGSVTVEIGGVSAQVATLKTGLAVTQEDFLIV